MVDDFINGVFLLLVLTETQLKGNGEVSWWGGGEDISVSVQEIQRGRECVAILNNDVWYSSVIDFINSKILWVKFKFLGLM